MRTILKRNTTSLCPECFKQVPAVVFCEEEKVFIEKECPQHGPFSSCLENNVNFYKRFASFSVSPDPFFHTLVLPVTYRCNLACSYCYAHYSDLPDRPLGYFKELISQFKGVIVGLSGGEPTLREDLPEFVSYIKKSGKISSLLTNGLRLVDERYLRSLALEGLDSVFFSFDSFSKDFYKLTKGEDILEQKKKALANLEKLNIKTVLSVTIYPGINEHELKDIFLFAFRNRHYITQLRLRSAAPVCHYEASGRYFTSDLIRMFSKQVNIEEESLLKYFIGRLPHFNLKREGHTIHHVQLLMKGVCVGDTFVPVVSRNALIGTFLCLKIALQKKGLLAVLKEGKRFFNIFFHVNKYKKFGSFFMIKNGMHIFATEFINLFKLWFGFFSMLPVRFISWPTKDNIDLEEVDRGIAQLTQSGDILNFCHAIVFDENFNKGRKRSA